MLQIFNEQDAKQSARVMERYLSKLGLKLQLGQAMDTLGVMAGFENWAGWKTAFSEAGLNARLSPESLRHIRENAHTQYGAEYALVTHTGFELRYGQEDELTYVRVCDPMGREIAYWTDDEWAEDPQVVMGALLGALAQGTPAVPGERKRFPKTAAQAVREPGVAPRIQDVPFESVSSVLLAGEWYAVVEADAEVLRKLAHPAEDPDEEFDIRYVALVLSDESVRVTLGELRALVWDAKQRCFVDPLGTTYQFNIAQSFADYLENSGGPINRDTEESKGPLQVYVVDKLGPSGHTYTRLLARSEQEALAKLAQERGWKRTPSDVVAKRLSDNEAGPYGVYVDNGFYDEVPTLEQALSLAEVLAPTAEVEATVEDNTCWMLWHVSADSDS